MATKLAKFFNSSVKFLVEFSVIYTIFDVPIHRFFFKSYVAFLGRNKINIFLDDWKDVAYEVKK